MKISVKKKVKSAYEKLRLPLAKKSIYWPANDHLVCVFWPIIGHLYCMTSLFKGTIKSSKISSLFSKYFIII